MTWDCFDYCTAGGRKSAKLAFSKWIEEWCVTYWMQKKRKMTCVILADIQSVTGVS